MQSYGGNDYAAAQLNHRVVQTMLDADTLPEIVSCTLNTDIQFPDTTRKRFEIWAVCWVSALLTERAFRMQNADHKPKVSAIWCAPLGGSATADIKAICQMRVQVSGLYLKDSLTNLKLL